MWILTFLPDSLVALVVYAIAAAGAGMFVLSKMIPWIPVLGIYKTPLELFGIAALVVGVYLQGGRANEAVWQARVKELEVKIAQAEAESAKENVKIVEKVVQKTQYIKTRGETITKYIDREIVKYDDRFVKGGVCEIPREFVKAHNDAAEAPPK
jgi:hypothetical protein